MPDITIVTEHELRQCVELDKTVIDIIDQAFATLAGGNVVMPPILSMVIEEHHGEVDVKTAYVPGLDGFAIKISPGFFNNPDIGLPSLNGLMVVFDSQTGIVKTVLREKGRRTKSRSAAAGAVASRLCVRAANSHAQEEAQAQGAAQQQASAEQVDNFKKAFSVYLEAKEYMVKFSCAG